MATRRPILVVDDEELLRVFITAALADEGYSVLAAPDGAAALALVHEAAPSLIVLDMRMPVLDGWGFARRYRALPGPHAPIICVTAAVDAAARAAEIGAPATLSKPFDLDELFALVRHYVPAPAEDVADPCASAPRTQMCTAARKGRAYLDRLYRLADPALVSGRPRPMGCYGASRGRGSSASTAPPASAAPRAASHRATDGVRRSCGPGAVGYGRKPFALRALVSLVAGFVTVAGAAVL